MLERLRDYRSQVEHHQQTLEAQVHERTYELENRTEEAFLQILRRGSLRPFQKPVVACS